MNSEPIESLIIVGGGTAGWMVAAALQAHLKGTVKISLVESSEIKTIGVGEATIPTIRRFYHALGLDDLEVMRATGATCKLGIKFNDWLKQGSEFIHPFGTFGQDINGIGFHHFWLKLRNLDKVGEISNYSLGGSLALNNKFNIPVNNPRSSASIFDWALHIDAGLFAEMLKKLAIANGVKRVDAKILSVAQRNDGYIKSLTLDDGREVHGDLFIDCSGFAALLIEGTLKTGYENWNHWLLCNSATVVQSKSTQSPAAFTDVTAKKAGWQWRIPLQHRAGNGHVYSDEHITDSEAESILRAGVKDELLAEPRVIRFVPGRRKMAWNKNCIAVGLSAGFLEPLESTSIALIETAIEKIKLLFPDKSFSPTLVDEFNEMTALEYERVRDFIILHYKLTKRTDSDFWMRCQTMELPDSLNKKMAIFKERGHFIRYRWEMFHPMSWLAIYTGFQYLPKNYDPAVDAYDVDDLAKNFKLMEESIRNLVDESIYHQEFLNNFVNPGFKEK